jgi:hypothetical protein
MGIQFTSPNCLPDQIAITPHPMKGSTTEQSDIICAMSATWLRHIVSTPNDHYSKVHQFALLLYEINTAIANFKEQQPDICTTI